MGDMAATFLNFLNPQQKPKSPTPSAPTVPDSGKRIGQFGLDPVTGLTAAARNIRARSIAASAEKRQTLLGGLDPTTESYADTMKRNQRRIERDANASLGQDLTPPYEGYAAAMARNKERIAGQQPTLLQQAQQAAQAELDSLKPKPMRQASSAAERKRTFLTGFGGRF